MNYQQLQLQKIGKRINYYYRRRLSNTMSIHKNYGKLTVAAFVAAASMSYAAPLTVSAELSNEF